MNKLIKQAFTLIELLVVIAIIGILSGLIVVTMGGVTTKANIAKAQVFSNSLKNSLMLNLISEWNFNNLSGNIGEEISTAANFVVDNWGSNSGTAYGSPTLKANSDCITDKCLSFNGSTDYIQIPGSNVSTSNLAITGAITLSVWVKFNANGVTQTILSRGIITMDGDYGYILWKDSSGNRIWFDTHSTTTVIELPSSNALTDNNWHYIVATWDGTTNANGKKIYIDSLLKGQQASTFSAMGQPNYNFTIGRDGSLNYSFNGLIDDVRVYNAAIPTSQIQEQYYAGLNKLLVNGAINQEEYIQKMEIVKLSMQ